MQSISQQFWIPEDIKNDSTLGYEVMNIPYSDTCQTRQYRKFHVVQCAPGPKWGIFVRWTLSGGRTLNLSHHHPRHWHVARRVPGFYLVTTNIVACTGLFDTVTMGCTYCKHLNIRGFWHSCRILRLLLAVMWGCNSRSRCLIPSVQVMTRIVVKFKVRLLGHHELSELLF